MSLATETVRIVPLGTCVERIGRPGKVAAVCQIRNGEYRMVWLVRAGGPRVFWASLNAEKWRIVVPRFDEVGAHPGVDLGPYLQGSTRDGIDNDNEGDDK